MNLPLSKYVATTPRKTVPGQLCRIILISTALFLVGCQGEESSDQIQILVSVLPEKTFVEAVGGDRVRVMVLVPPGAGHEAIEPSPREAIELTRAQVYFRIGAEFEEGWLERLRASNPNLRVVDLRKDIALRRLVEWSASDAHEHHAHGILDPHIWTDPLNVEIIARVIRDELTQLDPDYAADYASRFETFAQSIRTLHEDILQQLSDCAGCSFLVFHPAWGYFADRYHLRQIPIEIEGKEPSARELAAIIDLARAEGLKTLWAQPQYAIRSATVVAEAIGARVILADPLSENYFAEMRHVANLVSEQRTPP